MKAYSKENYPNFHVFELEVHKALDAVINLKVTSPKYGNGTISEARLQDLNEDYVTFTIQHFDLCVTIDFSGMKRTFVLSMALNAKSLVFDDITILAFKEILDVLKDSEAYRIEELTAIHKAKQDQEAAERQAVLAKQKAEKEKAKFELKKQKALEKLAKLKPENIAKLFKGSPTTFYESLGWMAKHITNIRPAMPDYMESWFVTNFGDVARTVVDSKKKTVNGFPMQWGLSLRITFNQEVSGPLEQRATSKNKKSIDNVVFVWDLIENYGFQFGKKQNLDRIIEEVPNEHLDEFKRGYAL